MSTDGWSCSICTYYNSNPNFLACEMCGEIKAQENDSFSIQNQSSQIIGHIQQENPQSNPNGCWPDHQSACDESTISEQIELLATIEEEERRSLIARQKREEEELSAIINERMKEIIEVQKELWAEHVAPKTAMPRAMNAERLDASKQELEQQKARLIQEEEALQRQQERLKEERLRLELQEQKEILQQQPKEERPGAVSARPTAVNPQQSKLEIIQQEREQLERRQREIEAHNIERPQAIDSEMREISDEFDAIDHRSNILIGHQKQQQQPWVLQAASTESTLEEWKRNQLKEERQELEQRKNEITAKRREQSKDPSRTVVPAQNKKWQPGVSGEASAASSLQEWKLNQINQERQELERRCFKLAMERSKQTSHRDVVAPHTVHQTRSDAVGRANENRTGSESEERLTEMARMPRATKPCVTSSGHAGLSREYEKVEENRSSRKHTSPTDVVAPHTAYQTQNDVLNSSTEEGSRNRSEPEQRLKEMARMTRASKPGATSRGHAELKRESHKIEENQPRRNQTYLGHVVALHTVHRTQIDVLNSHTEERSGRRLESEQRLKEMARMARATKPGVTSSG